MEWRICSVGSSLAIYKIGKSPWRIIFLSIFNRLRCCNWTYVPRYSSRHFFASHFVPFKQSTAKNRTWTKDTSKCQEIRWNKTNTKYAQGEHNKKSIVTPWRTLAPRENQFQVCYCPKCDATTTKSKYFRLNADEAQIVSVPSHAG